MTCNALKRMNRRCYEKNKQRDSGVEVIRNGVYDLEWTFRASKNIVFQQNTLNEINYDDRYE